MSTLVWTVRYSAAARQSLGQLSPPNQRRVVQYLKGVAALDDPSQRGKALTGNLAGYWRYRVGYFGVVCLIDRRRIEILAVEIGHRSTVYRGK